MIPRLERRKLEALELARKLVDALEAKKGEDILLLDLKEVAIFTDYFVICSGTSPRMLQTLMDTALEEAAKNMDVQSSVEGEPRDGWMLADFGDVVLHIFSADQRDYYGLEDFWAHAKVLLHLQ